MSRRGVGRRRWSWRARSGWGTGMRSRLDRKPGDLIAADTSSAVTEPAPYVSRGGHKLAAALDAFEIDPAGRVALDVGASTGGFTDVLLQRGATRVYALDVGRGQLAETLRRDPRVVSMERTNARELTAATLPEPIDIATIDVSFISLDLVLGPVAATLAPARVDRRPGQAAVRGRPGPHRPRRRARPGDPPRGPRAHRRERPTPRPRHTRRHRVADHRAGGQPRVPRPPRERARIARRSASGSPTVTEP